MSITVAGVIGGIAALALWAMSRPAPGTREEKLLNNNEDNLFDIEEVAAQCRLTREGLFILRTFRQSGNPHQEDRVYTECDAAVRAALSTFKRAKIDLVVIMDNTNDEFSFRRAVPDFRGRSEGKKVRWVEIHRAPNEG